MLVYLNSIETSLRKDLLDLLRELTDWLIDVRVLFKFLLVLFYLFMEFGNGGTLIMYALNPHRYLGVFSGLLLVVFRWLFLSTG